MNVGRSAGRPRAPASPCRCRSARARSGCRRRSHPLMSVSSRSPMNSGCSPPNRAIAASKIGRSGLPATTGIRPTAWCTADDERAVAGRDPRSTGIDQSMFVATHGTSGSARANDASARCVQPRSGENPWMTAAGESSALDVTVKPGFLDDARQAEATRDQHRRPGGHERLRGAGPRPATTSPRRRRTPRARSARGARRRRPADGRRCS